MSESAPSREQFALVILQRMRARGQVLGEFVADTFEIRHGAHRLFLANAYDSFCHARGTQRATIVENIVSMLTTPTPPGNLPFEVAESRLVAAVRERAYFSLSALDLQIGGSTQALTALCAPLSRWFVQTVVIDAPGFMSMVNDDMVRRWARPRDEIFARGLARLRDCTEPAFADEGGFWRGTWRDDYDSSRILLPEVFAGLGLAGDPVVTLPNRLTLLVAGADDAAGLGRMLARAEEIVRTEPRPQNSAPLVVRAGGVAEFHADPTSPVFHDVERAHRVAALLYYDEQAGKLEQLHTKQGRGLFVAKYSLVERDDGSYCAYAPWPRDVPALLPEADEVLFLDVARPEGEQCVATVPWPRVVETVPDLLKDTGLFPPRYEVAEFPSPEQLERMRG